MSDPKHSEYEFHNYELPATPEMFESGNVMNLTDDYCVIPMEGKYKDQKLIPRWRSDDPVEVRTSFMGDGGESVFTDELEGVWVQYKLQSPNGVEK